MSYFEGLVWEKIKYCYLVVKKILKQILDIFREIFGEWVIFLELIVDFYGIK